MTAYSSGRSPSLLPVFGILCLVAIGGLAVFGPMAMAETSEGLRNQVHADSKHTEAVQVRFNIRSNACDSIEMWYSRLLGQACLLCDMPGTNIVGGWIVRITENGGQRILPEDEIGEVTAYIATRQHWENKKIEGGYTLLSYYPTLRGVLNKTLGTDL